MVPVSRFVRNRWPRPISKVAGWHRTSLAPPRGELEITDVNNAYIREGTMSFNYLSGWWTDAGTFDSLRRATNLVAETRTGVHPE